MHTVGSWLALARQRLAHHSDSPQLDAEVLLCHVLAKPRSYCLAWPDVNLDRNTQNTLDMLLDARMSGMPIAYLTGRREFWSREFLVSPDVLIPRPETELLIDIALALLPASASHRVADLGTGSGVIAITLVMERPTWQITAVDCDINALRLAQQNAQRLACPPITWRHGDWLKPLQGERFALIISNPPYIAADDVHLARGDLRFEPRHALAAGPTGLDALQTIAATARSYLDNGGYLLLEHGYQQHTALHALLQSYGYRNLLTHRDWAGHPRVTQAQWILSSHTRNDA